MALFRHFFAPCIAPVPEFAGCVTFDFRCGASVGFPKLDLKRNWGHRRRDWCLVKVPASHPCFEVPVDRPKCSPCFTAISPRDGDFQPVLDRLRQLHRRGMSGSDIIFHFILFRLAPLQRRSRMMWAYRMVPEDPIRLSSESMSGCEVLARVAALTESQISDCPLNVKPMFEEDNRCSLQASLPSFTARGVKDFEDQEPTVLSVDLGKRNASRYPRLLSLLTVRA